jgi:hypothetical protein
MSKLWSTLLGRERGRRQSVQEKFNALVRSIADGAEPTASTVEPILDAAGKSVAELQSAVELLLKRRQAREKLDLARAVPAERARIGEALLAANREYESGFAALQEKYERAVEPLKTRLPPLDPVEQAGREASLFLEETAQLDPDTLAKIAQLREQQAEYRRNAFKAAKLADQAREAGEVVTPNDVVAPGSWTRKPEFLAKQAGYRQQQTKYLAEVASAEGEAARLQKEIDDLEELKMAP